MIFNSGTCLHAQCIKGTALKQRSSGDKRRAAQARAELTGRPHRTQPPAWVNLLRAFCAQSQCPGDAEW